MITYQFFEVYCTDAEGQDIPRDSPSSVSTLTSLHAVYGRKHEILGLTPMESARVFRASGFFHL
jgi:hypothetical protein